MAGYLLDTNVISETRKPRPHGGVMAWLQAQNDDDIFLPALSFGEIQAGIEQLRRSDAERAALLEAWVRELERHPRILAMNASCFRTWARMMHRKSPDLTLDGMIAATAHVHGLTVATRNVRDFSQFDVPLLDPFGYRG